MEEGGLYKLGMQWGVWDDFYQGVIIGKMGAKLMKHMNRIVTQQFKTILNYGTTIYLKIRFLILFTLQ